VVLDLVFILDNLDYIVTSYMKILFLIPVFYSILFERFSRHSGRRELSFLVTAVYFTIALVIVSVIPRLPRYRLCEALYVLTTDFYASGRK